MYMINIPWKFQLIKIYLVIVHSTMYFELCSLYYKYINSIVLEIFFNFKYIKITMNQKNNMFPKVKQVIVKLLNDWITTQENGKKLNRN